MHTRQFMASLAMGEHMRGLYYEEEKKLKWNE